MLLADGVDLKFTEGALKAIAGEAMKRRTRRARVRSILEERMTNIMFEVPSQKGIAQCVIDETTILEKSDPKLISREQILAETRERMREERANLHEVEDDTARSGVKKRPSFKGRLFFICKDSILNCCRRKVWRWELPKRFRRRV
jgi:ATP-dependent protease Clp ATPase subunit